MTMSDGEQWFWASQVVYKVVICFSKMSRMLYIRRIFPLDRMLQANSKVWLLVVVVSTTTVILLTCLEQITPVLYQSSLSADIQTFWVTESGFAWFADIGVMIMVWSPIRRQEGLKGAKRIWVFAWLWGFFGR